MPNPFERLECHSRRAKRDREIRANPVFLDWLWIPGQAFSLPGMTLPKRMDQPESVQFAWKSFIANFHYRDAALLNVELLS
jgi:hypothetical protein